MSKPFSPSCERNRGPLLEVLSKYLADRRHLLEVGSGTGQHAAYLAPEFPHITWQTSDMAANHDGINQWVDESPAKNIERPISFEIGVDEYPQGDYDIVFTGHGHTLLGLYYAIHEVHRRRTNSDE